MPTLAPGDAFPDFDLADDRGQRVSRASLAGKPFVLFVYPKADTSGCTLEAQDFTRLKPRFDAAGVAVVGLSADPEKKQAKFRDKAGLGVPLLSDEGHDLLGAMGVWVEKSMYGRSYMGAERTTVLVGADGKVAQVWPKVSVTGHAEEVLAAAEALGR